MSIYNGKPLGTYCDFASYSFQASKHITCGEGGALTTNSRELADAARRFTSLGYSTVNAKKGKITKEDYAKLIESADDFLSSGNSKKIQKDVGDLGLHFDIQDQECGYSLKARKVHGENEKYGECEDESRTSSSEGGDG